MKTELKTRAAERFRERAADLLALRRENAVLRRLNRELRDDNADLGMYNARLQLENARLRAGSAVPLEAVPDQAEPPRAAA